MQTLDIRQGCPLVTCGKILSEQIKLPVFLFEYQLVVRCSSQSCVLWNNSVFPSFFQICLHLSVVFMFMVFIFYTFEVTANVAGIWYTLGLGNDHLTWRGGYGFFLKKIFWFPMLLKKYSDFGGGKKISDSEF